jgi:hypothetical protein
MRDTEFLLRIFLYVPNPVPHGQTGWSMLLAPYGLPPLDQAFAALLDDLQQRGLLHDTLVVAMGEFGRTPRINPQQGREH